MKKNKALALLKTKEARNGRGNVVFKGPVAFEDFMFLFAQLKGRIEVTKENA